MTSPLIHFHAAHLYELFDHVKLILREYFKYNGRQTVPILNRVRAHGRRRVHRNSTIRSSEAWHPRPRNHVLHQRRSRHSRFCSLPSTTLGCSTRRRSSRTAPIRDGNLFQRLHDAHSIYIFGPAKQTIHPSMFTELIPRRQ